MTTRIQTTIKNLKFKWMIKLLAWYGGFDMDQWDMIKIPTSNGPVYVTIIRGLPVGTEEYQYREIE